MALAARGFCKRDAVDIGHVRHVFIRHPLFQPAQILAVIAGCARLDEVDEAERCVRLVRQHETGAHGDQLAQRLGRVDMADTGRGGLVDGMEGGEVSGRIGTYRHGPRPLPSLRS